MVLFLEILSLMLVVVLEETQRTTMVLHVVECPLASVRPQSTKVVPAVMALCRWGDLPQGVSMVLMLCPFLGVSQC